MAASSVSSLATALVSPYLRTDTSQQPTTKSDSEIAKTQTASANDESAKTSGRQGTRGGLVDITV